MTKVLDFKVLYHVNFLILLLKFLLKTSLTLRFKEVVIGNYLYSNFGCWIKLKLILTYLATNERQGL